MKITVRAAMALRDELDHLLIRHTGTVEESLELSLRVHIILIDLLDQALAEVHDDQHRLQVG